MSLVADDRIAIGSVVWRDTVCVEGRVRSMRITPWADVPSLECTIVDETGGLTVVFLGRRKIAGVHPGTVLRVEGVAGAHHGKLAIMNPEYEIVTTPHVEAPHH
ncbi:MAG TPA: OB-fold nucleic acid binding domain-containing protein [Acidimicrobiales bacterium]|nr:OB-fold nucleic acid binding domain-containing protein [Acidimicrobiales bacterium]